MKISMYFPTERDKLFCEYSEHDFVFNTCDNSCDLVYVASISKIVEGVKAKHKFNIPLVCWCWDIPFNWRDWQMSQQGLIDNRDRDNINNSRIQQLKECKLVITPTKWVQKTIKEQYNADSEQIYQFIDTKGLDKIPTQDRSDKIIQISRFFYNKKFHNTVYAAKDVNYDVNFFGTGINGNYGKEIKTAIKQHGTMVNIHENANRDELIKSIKQSRILVSPSVFEGWGITPVEALYCGTPVLLSDLPVFQEIYGDSVIYHKAGDEVDMKEKLELLLSDETLQKNIIKNTRDIISEFTPDKFAKRWDNLIKSNL